MNTTETSKPVFFFNSVTIIVTRPYVPTIYFFSCSKEEPCNIYFKKSIYPEGGRWREREEKTSKTKTKKTREKRKNRNNRETKHKNRDERMKKNNERIIKISKKAPTANNNK